MRNPALLLATGLAISTLATASPLTAVVGQPKHQSLERPDALNELKSSNPRHYRIALQILAAANQICDAKRGAPLKMKFDARNVTCGAGFWFTSLPPKRALQFRIDDTVYSALVEFRDTRLRLTPAN